MTDHTKEFNNLKERLSNLETELEKVRGCSPLTHGWQTQKYAKASRKWDILAQQRIFIVDEIEKLKVKSRSECPAKMVCQCGADGNWDGFCKLNYK